MTEIVFQKLEEKVMQVLADYEKIRVEAGEKRSEVDHLRNEVHRLTAVLEARDQELSSLKQEKEGYMRKLDGLLSVLDDSVTTDTRTNNVVSPTLLAVKPVLVSQG